MSNFWTRALTGTAFVIVMVGAVYAGVYTTAAIFTLIAALGYREWEMLTSDKPTPWFPPLFAVLSIGFWGLQLYAPDSTSYFVIAYLLGVAVLYVLQRSTERTYLSRGIGFLYLNGSLATLFALGSMASASFDPKPILLVFVLIWSNDTGAYLVGKSIGKHKMYPRVSPGKTWEGTVGGVLIAAGVGYLAGTYVFEKNAWMYAVAGVLTGIAGTLGDLFESRLKRERGVKDSGNLLPGHGGILDRFDALLFAAPVNYLYFQWIT